MGTLSFVGFLFVMIGVTSFIRTKKIRKEGLRSKARVIDYENKFRRVGGTWTTLEYPVVEYQDESGGINTGWVKYASSSGRYFELNQEIEIIRHGKYIYYADSVSDQISLLAIAGITLVLIDLFLVN